VGGILKDVLDRQTNSFIEKSIEAGILLGGNGKDVLDVLTSKKSQ
jgi:hypothetical protein